MGLSVASSRTPRKKGGGGHSSKIFLLHFFCFCFGKKKQKNSFVCRFSLVTRLRFNHAKRARKSRRHPKMGASSSKGRRRQCSVFDFSREEPPSFVDAIDNLPSNDSFDDAVTTPSPTTDDDDTPALKNFGGSVRDEDDEDDGNNGVVQNDADEDKKNNNTKKNNTNNTKKTWTNPHKQNTPEFIEFELKQLPVGKMHPDLVEKAVEIVEKWKKDFPLSVWTRTVKGDRVAKEFNESAPVIARMIKFVDEEFEKPANEGERITIVDLCSGFGYLGMFLSEMLDKNKVRKIYLIDKEWPQFGSKPKENRMSNAHIVGIEDQDNGEEGGIGSWTPKYSIPLLIRKVDLKAYDNVQSMAIHVFGETRHLKSPLVILGIHLCGTLSFKACEMFNANANAIKLILKPCCLPNWAIVHQYRDYLDPPTDYFGPFGSQKFYVKTRDVCAKGKWKKNTWIGPPRQTLEPKFNLWAESLCRSVEEVGVTKKLERIEVQETGGFQNTYIFADRLKNGDSNTIVTTDWYRNRRRFPTWNGGEAGAWNPDGRGKGTHFKKKIKE